MSNLTISFFQFWKESTLRTFRGQFWWIGGMRWEEWEWTGCSTGDGEGIKGYKDGGPPTLCKPASQQGGGEEVNSLAGGAWRGWRSAGGYGSIFGRESFRLKWSNSYHLCAVDWPARRGTSFQPSWMGGENFKWKWKFYCTSTFSCSIFMLFSAWYGLGDESTRNKCLK